MDIRYVVTIKHWTEIFTLEFIALWFFIAYKQIRGFDSRKGSNIGALAPQRTSEGQKITLVWGISSQSS